MQSSVARADTHPLALSVRTINRHNECCARPPVFVAICDSAGRVLGTITDRDITIRVVATRESMAQPISRFMTQSVVACRAGDDLRYAQELMSQEKVSRIMCVNDEGVLEGIISLSDIAQIEDGARASATLRNVSDREVRM